MNHIGNIIREYREMLSLSRKELAEGLCTEKYIYLIEKGERTPSVNVLSIISERIGVDLYDYYQYLGCNDPIVIREAIRQFNICRKNNNYIDLGKTTEAVRRFPDFNIKPWSYEIELNLLNLIVFKNRNYIEGKEKIIHLLNGMDVQYMNSYYVLNLHTLLSVCCRFLGELTSAKEAIYTAERMITNKLNIDKFQDIVIGVKISSISISYYSGEYELVLKKGHDFLQYLYSLSVYLYIYFVFFYLSFSYYKIGKPKEASENFKKGFYCLMVEDKQMEVNLLYELEEFNILLYHSNLKQYDIDEFLERYQLI